MAFTLFLISGLTAINATSVGVLSPWGQARFHTSHEGFALTLSLYLIAVAFTPLVLAPMSELFGRNSIYFVSCSM